MKMKHTIEKSIPVFLLTILLTASNLFALSPKPKKPLPELHTVLRIIEGDTIDILYYGKKERIRLLTINTPERNHRGYKQAKKALKKLVSGRKVRLEFEVQGKLKRGGYGRILAYIWVNEINVNV